MYKLPPVRIQFTFNFCLIYVFLLPPILILMHLRIMLYTYWTPLALISSTLPHQHK